MGKPFVHRFIPNTTPNLREAMLKEIGFDSVEQIYEEIPEEIRFKGDLKIPKSPASEYEVSRRITAMLAKNRTTNDYLSFLGAGCWPHYVPALCDEIIGRSEFLTAYAGEPYTDHGRYQALFEYESMMADLLDMDVVTGPTYDGPSSAGDAVLTAARATNRGHLLVPATISPDRLAVLKVYCERWLDIETVSYRPDTGELDLDYLKRKISDNTAAVYIENPTYLGFLESQCEEIAQIAHARGALLVVHVNPLSLGVLAPPGEYGADIACGEGQPLGMHMSCGGNALGILATRDDERLVSVLPSLIVGMTTTVKGERAFSWHTLFERTVFYSRDRMKSFTGTSSWLWAIAAGVYMSLMGPRGMRRLGEVNMQKAYYAMDRLSKIPGVLTPLFPAAHFNEFVVNFDATGKTVVEINQALFQQGILGGKDISQEFPQLGNSALYCTTEVHSQADIDRLADTLENIVR